MFRGQESISLKFLPGLMAEGSVSCFCISVKGTNNLGPLLVPADRWNVYSFSEKQFERSNRFKNKIKSEARKPVSVHLAHRPNALRNNKVAVDYCFAQLWQPH